MQTRGPSLHIMASVPSSQYDLAQTVPRLIASNIIEQNPAQAAGALVTLLTEGPQEAAQVRPATPGERLQVVQLMMEKGVPAYLRHFTDDIRGRQVLAAWLSDATPPRRPDVQDVSEQYASVVVPLLQLLLRLPIELDHLKDHVGLGKLITGAQKRLRSEQARQLADAVKDKWSALVPSSSTTASQSPAALAMPAKRPAAPVASDAASKRAKGEATPTSATMTARTTAATVARPAANLLGASSARARLGAPTDRKGSPQLVDAKPSEPQRRASARSTVPAASSATKDLASFMSLIDQPTGTPPPETATDTKPPQPEVERKKKKKSVRWRDHDGEALVAVKLIEPAVYDEEVPGGVATVGQLDMEEGGVFRLAHAEMEEYIDWYMPPCLLLPPSPPMVPEKGSQSIEKCVQEEREHTVPEVIYTHAADIPETPGAPEGYAVAFALSGSEPRNMTMGPQLRPFSMDVVAVASADSPIPGVPSSVGTLLQNLKNKMKSTVESPVPPASVPVVPASTGPPDAPVPPVPMPPWAAGAVGVPSWPFPFPPPGPMPGMGPPVAAEGGAPPPKDKPPRSRGGRSRKSGKNARSSDGQRNSGRGPNRLP
ncbi:Uncharacterized protein MSYG_0150 [Malassezia sympodialis ATCC 42132]|uniref:TFIIS N-terminal domain-containing protein n=1 Tax=Malassezia sympodialis (strain ATCC 42132) TaxID=1230383 RepID=A0A1M8A0A4_MALS4|nr:Uncharacterized protein MSYG_0150 [Malassezia sympodialis ATCC 42132]